MKYLKRFNESKLEDLEDYFQEMFDKYKIPKYSKEVTTMYYNITEDGILITNIFSHNILVEIMGYINNKKEQIEKRLGQKFIHNQHRFKYFNNPETLDKVGYLYEIEIYLD